MAVGTTKLISMLWNGVEYLEGWSKFDLEYIDNVILSQQEKRFTINLLKGKSRKLSFDCFHRDTFRIQSGTDKCTSNHVILRGSEPSKKTNG